MADTRTGLPVTPAAREGLLDAQGRIATLGRALLADLGFRAEDDLSGLPVASLWPFAQRNAVSEALARAAQGDPTRLPLDLGYLTGVPACREMVVEPAADGALAVRLAG